MAKNDYPRPYSSTRVPGLFEGWSPEFTREDLYDAVEEAEGALIAKYGRLPGEIETLHDAAPFLYSMQRARYQGMVGPRLFHIAREPFFEDNIIDGPPPAADVIDGLAAFLLARPAMVPGWFNSSSRIADLITKSICYILGGIVVAACLTLAWTMFARFQEEIIADISLMLKDPYNLTVTSIYLALVFGLFFFHAYWIKPLRNEALMDSAYTTITALIARKVARKHLSQINKYKFQAGCNSVLLAIILIIGLVGVGLILVKAMHGIFGIGPEVVFYGLLSFFWGISIFTYFQAKLKKSFGYNPRDWAKELVETMRDIKYEEIE